MKPTAVLKSIRNCWLKFVAWPYSLLLLGFVFLIPVFVFLVPPHYYTDDNNARAIFLAFLCGAFVGLTEIASRYPDEQMKSILSPDGLVYMLCNGAISMFALVLIFHFRNTLTAFAAFKENSLAAAIAAGFGATAIMRTRLAVIKGSDNKDISIGPDIVINLLLAMIDRRIDRWRASHRLNIISDHFEELRALGTIDEAGKYLGASLLSFQNLSVAEKQRITDIIESNKKLRYSDNIQLQAVGFLFLTIVGEENFASVLAKARQIQGAGGSPPPAPLPAPVPIPPAPVMTAAPPIPPANAPAPPVPPPAA